MYLILELPHINKHGCTYALISTLAFSPILLCLSEHHMTITLKNVAQSGYFPLISAIFTMYIKQFFSRLLILTRKDMGVVEVKKLLLMLL